jgi:aminotransferase
LQVAGNYYGAGIVPIDTAPFGFQLTFRSVREAAHRAVGHKVLIINSPNNPTGMVYDRSELERTVAWCVGKGITVISDECYSAFSPDPDFSLRQLSPEVIVIDSFSKAHAMMGYRLGYVLAPPELIERLQLYAENLLGCPSAVAEAAGLAALALSPVPDYAEQRNLIQWWLDQHRISYGKSSGGIYAFADFSPHLKRLGLSDSVSLAEHLLAAADVAVTPGSAFGNAYDGHLRLSYALDATPLSEALAKLDKSLF